MELTRDVITPPRYNIDDLRWFSPSLVCNIYKMTGGSPGVAEISVDDPAEGAGAGADDTDPEIPEPPLDTSDYKLSIGLLTPRHRRLAQLAAQGVSKSKISRELGYSPTRITNLLKNPLISEEVLRLQDRLFEETIESRLKSFSEVALDNIRMILTDRTNAVKVSEKMALSQWLVEMLNGKATQKVEAGENMLALFLDRLEARSAPREVVPRSERKLPDLLIEARPATEVITPHSEGDLTQWVDDFCSGT